MQSTLTTFAVAEAICLLTRSADVLMLAKSPGQRTKQEEYAVSHGLARDVILDLLLFVPVSVFTVLETVKHLLPETLISHPACPGLLGVVSFGFPFKTLRVLVIRFALRTLSEFRDVLNESEKNDPVDSTRSTAPSRMLKNHGSCEEFSGFGPFSVFLALVHGMFWVP